MSIRGRAVFDTFSAYFYEILYLTYTFFINNNAFNKLYLLKMQAHTDIAK